MRRLKHIAIYAGLALVIVVVIGIGFKLLSPRSSGTRLAEISTTFRLWGPNDKIYLNRFADPQIDGISCYVTRAVTGGITGFVGLAEDPSNMHINCIQTGPVSVHGDLASLDNQEVFTERASIFFKSIHVRRFVDADNHAVAYVIISTKLIDGSPENSVAAVSLKNPWGAS